MPTTTLKGASWYYDSSGIQIMTGQSHIVLKTYVEKPVTIRRKKPIDLFANATPRKVVSELTEYTYGRLYNSPSAGHVLDAPMSYWTGISPNPPFYEPSVSDFAFLDNRARGKIKDQNVNLANSLAEYRQTSNLLLSTARDVIRTFHTLRSGRPIETFVSMLAHPETRNARRLSNRWLEYQFGWKPLLSDVHGSAQALAKQLQTGIHLYQSVSDRKSGKTTTPYILGKILTEVDLSMKVRVRYKISATGLKTLSELGITNPLSVAWEIVPWSFVIDWMIPVGNYLGGLDALVGVTDLGVIRSYKYKVKAFQALDYSGGGQFFKPYPTGTYTSVVTNRLPVSSTLSFGSLRYDPSITKTRLVTAMALLRQLKR